MTTLCSHTQLPEKLESSPNLGDIFRKHGDQFRSEHRLHPRQHKIMYDIEHCRCGEFSTHWEFCDTFSHMEKDTTPAGTATVQAATILPRKDGAALESMICCLYRILIVFSIHTDAESTGKPIKNQMVLKNGKNRNQFFPGKFNNERLLSFNLHQG